MLVDLSALIELCGRLGVNFVYPEYLMIGALTVPLFIEIELDQANHRRA